MKKSWFLKLMLILVLLILTPYVYAMEVEVDNFSDLQDIFASSDTEKADTVKLTGNIDVENNFVWSIYGDYTLDLNGHEINMTSYQLSIWIYADATVTFTDTSVDSTGKITGTSTTYQIGVHSNSIMGSHQFDIIFAGGTYEGNSSSGNLIYIWGNDSNNQSIIFNDGVFTNYYYVFGLTSVENIVLNNFVRRNTTEDNIIITNDSVLLSDALSAGKELIYYTYSNPNYYLARALGTTDLNTITVYPNRYVAVRDEGQYHIVSFNSNGGTFVESQEVKDGETAEYPSIPTKDGFDAYGWYREPELSNSYSFSSTVHSDLNLYLRWREIITSAGVTLTLPVAGEHPNGVGLASDTTKYNIYGSVEFDDVADSYRTLTAEDTFEAGKTYRVFVWLRPTSDYVLKNTTNVTFNGNNTYYWTTIGDGMSTTGYYFLYTVPEALVTEITANITSFDFGEIHTGFTSEESASLSKVVRITNTGTTTITLSNVNPTNGPFGNIWYDTTLEIAPGEYKDVTLILHSSNGWVNVANTYNCQYTFTGTNIDNASDKSIIYLNAKVVLTEPVTMYTVTFNTMGGSSIDNQNVVSGEKATRPITDPTRDNYEFVNWYQDSTGLILFDFNATIDGPTTIYAKWNEVVVNRTISFDANGGEGLMDNVLVANNTVYNLPEPTFTAPVHKEFDKWNIEGYGNYDAGTNFQVSSDITLKALWKDVDKYTITFNSNGGSAVLDLEYYPDEITVKPENPTKENYEFVNWYTDSELETLFVWGTTLTGNINLYAKWNEIVVYNIADGNKNFVKDESENLVITCDGNFADFVRLELDGEIIDASNYEAVSGSTIVTLKTTYLNTLTNGTHQLTFVYTNGNVSTNLTISASTNETPNTLDNLSMWVILFVLSILGLGYSAYKYKNNER